MNGLMVESGAVLRYHDLPGPAAPIVFIHGLGCASSFDYPPTAAHPSLTAHRRILVDLPGSGYSDKPDDADYTISWHAACIAEVIRRLDVNSLVLFGHSMGGAVAIETAELCAGRMKALILAESNLDSGGGVFSRKIAAYGEDRYVKTGHGRLIGAGRKRGGEGARWAASMASSSPAAVYRTSVSLIGGCSPSWRETLYGLDMPRSFLFGERSLPDDDYDVLQAAGIAVDIVPEAGHNMAWDNPGGLAEVIHRCIPQEAG